MPEISYQEAVEFAGLDGVPTYDRTQATKCIWCGMDMGIRWILFNHGPHYNPWRSCEQYCKNCGQVHNTDYFFPHKTRKVRIARCRLEFNDAISRANNKGLIQ